MTLRALIEAGPGKVLDEQDRDPSFRLREVSFGGEGLALEFAEEGWQRIRDAIYEGRGA